MEQCINQTVDMFFNSNGFSTKILVIMAYTKLEDVLKDVFNVLFD